MYQHLEYFAFGETFVEEHSNRKHTPYKFNGKELDEETGLYYYGARYYDARTSVWLSVDAMTEKYPGMSPYSFSGNNPVRFVDPDGNELTEAAKQWFGKLMTNVTGRIKRNNEKMAKKMSMIETGMNSRGKQLSSNRINRLSKGVSKLQQDNAALGQVANEIIELEGSSQMYDINLINASSKTSAGELTYDNSSGNVVINVYGNSKNQLATFAHEAKHAYQFETGKISLAWNGAGGGSLYDISDEIEAYTRGQMFGANKGASITESWVRKHGYTGLSSGPLDVNSPTNNPLKPGETHGDAIRNNIQMLNSYGKNPREVIRK